MLVLRQLMRQNQHLEELPHCLNELSAAMKWRIMKSTSIRHDKEGVFRVLRILEGVEDRNRPVSRVRTYGGEVVQNLKLPRACENPFQDDFLPVLNPYTIEYRVLLRRWTQCEQDAHDADCAHVPAIHARNLRSRGHFGYIRAASRMESSQGYTVV